MSNSSENNNSKKPYTFGGINDFNLEEIENEVLNDSVYLDVFAGSDARFKENFSPMDDALKAINSIQAMNYTYKTEEYPEKNFPKGIQSGVIAGELEKVYPIAVEADADGMKYVNYARLAPLLIESVKELTTLVEEQAQRIKELEKKLG